MKRKVIKGFKSVLKGIDSFGQPIYLSYRGKTQYKTWFGGILTLILIGSIMAFSFESMLSLFMKENIKLSSSILFESDPRRIELSANEGFFCAIGLSPDYFNNITSRHFEVIAESRETLRFSNATERKTNKKLNLVQCKREHFPADYDYVKQQNQNWWCFQTNETLVLEGRYESDVFRHVKINFQRCVNTTENNNYCAPWEETENLIVKNDGKIYAKIIFSNKIINLQDSNKPYIDFMEQSTFFLMDPKRFFKQTDIFFRVNDIKRDENIYYYGNKQSTIITFDNFREQISSLNSNICASLYLRVSVNRAQYNSSAEKFTTMLSRIGGLASVLFSIIQIIALLYNRQKLLLSLSNFLYNTVDPKEIDYSQKNSLKSPKGSGIEWPEKIKKEVGGLKVSKEIEVIPTKMEPVKFQKKINQYFVNDESSGTDPGGGKSRYSRLLGMIDKYLKRFKKQKFSWKFFLSSGCLLDKKDKEKTALLTKSMKKIDRDMDIIQILMKVKEVDKLKKFLFDSDQRVLFEFFPKPIIMPGYKKNSSNTHIIKKSSSICYLHNDYLKKIVSMNSINGFEDANTTSKLYVQLFKSYKNILEGNEKQDKNNKKLVSLLGDDLLKIFNSQSD